MRLRRNKQGPILQTEALERLLRTARDWEPGSAAPDGIAHRALAEKITPQKASRVLPFWWQVGGTVSACALTAASVLFVQLSGGVPAGIPPAAQEKGAVSSAATAAAETPQTRTLPLATKSSRQQAKPSVTPPTMKPAAEAAATATIRPRRNEAHHYRPASLRRERQMVEDRGSESTSALAGAVASPKEAAKKGASLKTGATPVVTPMWKEVAVQRPVYGMLAPAMLTTTNEQGETEEMPVVLDVALNTAPDNFGE